MSACSFFFIAYKPSNTLKTQGFLTSLIKRPAKCNLISKIQVQVLLVLPERNNTFILWFYKEKLQKQDQQKKKKKHQAFKIRGSKTFTSVLPIQPYHKTWLRPHHKFGQLWMHSISFTRNIQSEPQDRGCTSCLCRLSRKREGVLFFRNMTFIIFLEINISVIAKPRLPS